MNLYSSSQLIDKLKERKIVQWAAGYFAVAWGLLEVLGFLANNFDWPAFIVRSSTIILGAGFFVTIVLAWHHGDRGRQRVTGIEAMSLGAIIVAAGVLTVFINTPEPVDRVAAPGGPVTRLTIALPRTQRLSIQPFGGFPLAISPDGSRVAYVADTEEGSRLVIRPFDSFEAVVVRDTAGAELPFFSPDGKWIGFFTRDEIRKVPVDGGAPLRITSISGRSSGASWGADGRILYSLRSQGLWIVSAVGGEPSQIFLKLSDKANTEGRDPAVFAGRSVPEWPSFLPDGEHAIVTDGAGVLLLTLSTGETRRLITAKGRQARYLQSGYLAYTETGEHVRAVPFSLEKLEITGLPFPVLDDVFRAPGGGAVFFDVSQTGTLIYVSGGFERSLLLADRNGRTELLTDEKRGFRFPRFDPSGDRVVVTIDPRPSSLWIYDVIRGIGEKVTSDGHNLRPVWQDNTGQIVHARNDGLHAFNPENPDRSTRLFSAQGVDSKPLLPTTSSADGRIIAGNIWDEHGGFDIFTLLVNEPDSVRLFLQTEASEFGPYISPDDDWVCYVSDSSGRDEVYVRAFPGPGAAIRVSLDGGTDPVWSRDSRELFFRKGDAIMSAQVMTEPSLSFSEPDTLFKAELDTTQLRNWNVGPDDRFVLVESDPTTTREFQVVLNWFKAVRDAEN